MKTAHMALITPGRCGLYETTRELLWGLRHNGVDARLVDPKEGAGPGYPVGKTSDRGVPFADYEWAKTADVIVNHSGFDGTPIQNLQTPVVHICHGRPLSSFIIHNQGRTPIYSWHYLKNRDARFKAVVTFWPEHEGYHRVMFPDVPVHVIPPPVDLEAWSPEGPNGYKFAGHRAEINVVCTDAWREDVDPFMAVNSYALWARGKKNIKLHIYAAPVGDKMPKGWSALLKRLQDDGTMGEIKPWVGGLANVYRSASLMVTPHRIDVRSVREAMACGCPVARTPELAPTELSMALTMDRKQVRKAAERKYDPKVCARAFVTILKEALA